MFGLYGVMATIKETLERCTEIPWTYPQILLEMFMLC